MARFEDHCEESIRLFGQPYAEVHRWLDAFAGSPEYGYRHRKKRHHGAGILEAMALFGEAAGPVARQHIITDLKDEGWTEADHLGPFTSLWVCCACSRPTASPPRDRRSSARARCREGADGRRPDADSG